MIDDDLARLLHGARGDEIAIAGVRPGDPATNVDRARIDGADGFADDPGHLELPARIARVIAGGGFLRAGAVGIRVEHGIVSRVFVRGSALDALGIARAADVERLFGVAEGRSSTLGWAVHHYPSRAVVVAWDRRADRLEHVALGADPWREPELGAAELVAHVIEAWGRLEGRRWAEPPTSERGDHARWHRIDALARALGCDGIGALRRGEFLHGRADREPILAEIASRSPARNLPRHMAVAPVVFTHLLRYRADAERVLGATGGWLECGDPVLLGMVAEQQRIATALRASLAEVDQWLAQLVDPRARRFRQCDLVARHGYPDVDLAESDDDDV